MTSRPISRRDRYVSDAFASGGRPSHASPSMAPPCRLASASGEMRPGGGRRRFAAGGRSGPDTSGPVWIGPVDGGVGSVIRSLDLHTGCFVTSGFGGPGVLDRVVLHVVHVLVEMVGLVLVFGAVVVLVDVGSVVVLGLVVDLAGLHGPPDRTPGGDGRVGGRVV